MTATCDRRLEHEEPGVSGQHPGAGLEETVIRLRRCRPNSGGSPAPDIGPSQSRSARSAPVAPDVKRCEPSRRDGAQSAQTFPPQGLSPGSSPGTLENCGSAEAVMPLKPSSIIASSKRETQNFNRDRDIAVRAVRSVGQSQCGDDSGVAGPAGVDAPEDHRTDGAIAGGTQPGATDRARRRQSGPWGGEP